MASKQCYLIQRNLLNNASLFKKIKSKLNNQILLQNTNLLIFFFPHYLAPFFINFRHKFANKKKAIFSKAHA